MARIQKPPPGRLIISFIYSSMDALADSLEALEKRFGRVQFETIEIVCAAPEMYVEEMGDNLVRRIFSFERMIDRDNLVEIKKTCHKIEVKFADQINDYHFRAVNLDPGILTTDNLVMASHRDQRQRIYLSDGIFAEVTLVHSQGCFMRLPWTPPDYCNDEAADFFERVRETFALVEPVESATS